MSADVMAKAPLVQHFDLIAQAPGGVARLRELILTLAVQGKLVPQDPSDEPASVLLQKIRAEKDRLIEEGKIKRDKPLAEIADEEKPFELPDSWQWVRLGTVYALEYGASLPEKSRLQGKVPVYGSNGVVGFHNESLIQQPSLVVGRKGSVGAVNLSIGPFWPIDTSYYVTPPEGVDLLYSYYLFRSLELGKHDKATAIPGINRNDVYKEVIGLPPLAEQSRIVTRVEELMQLCDALEASGQLEAQQHAQLVSTLLSTLTQSETPEAVADNWQCIATHFDLLLDRPEAVDALEQTILQLAVRGLLVPQDPTDEPASVLLQKIRTEKDHLIAQGKIKRDKPLPPITGEEKPFELPRGWEWVRLGNLGVTQTGGTPASNKPEYFDGNFPFIGPGQITPNGQVLTAEKFVSELGALESSVVEPGDILMVCIGGSIGKCAAATFPTAFNQQINSIHPLLLSREYVLNAMSSIDFTQAVLNSATGSATPIISKGKWDLLLLPLPPQDEQERIVIRVNELRALCADLRRRLFDQQTTQTHLADALLMQEQGS